MSNRKTTPDVLGDVLGDVMTDTGASAPPTVQIAPTARSTTARSTAARQAAPKPATPKPAPATWEYLTVVLGEHRGLRPKSLNGQPLEQWKAQPVLSDFLTIVGRYGWEMVGIVDSRCGEKEAYFKRPQRE